MAKYLRENVRKIAGVCAGASILAASAASALCEEPERRKAFEAEAEAEADFVVVGAGSAGCALATRIAQAFPKRKTVLIEAGDTDDLEAIQSSVDYFGKAEKAFGSDRDWMYVTDNEKGLSERAIYWPRGKVVGGCSSFNTMVYLRGSRWDYDNWQSLVQDSKIKWDYASLLPFFKRAETHPGDASVHGKNGPMTVAPLGHKQHHPDDARHFVTKLFIKAAQFFGHKENTDWALNGNDGVGANDVNAKNGRRCNTSSYLREIGAYPSHSPGGDLKKISTSPPGALEVWLKTRALKIVFDENNVAQGVQVLREKSDDEDDDEEGEEAGERILIKAKKKVILCGGAIDSPRLLLLSGIGPKEQLENVGIKCKANLPGVGQNLKDHMHVPICYRIEGGVKPHSHSNICEGTLFTKLDKNSPSADLQVHIGTLFFEPDGFSPKGEGFTLTPSLIRPRSVGSLQLVSSSPFDKPQIKANYLQDPYDVDLLVRGMKHVRKVGEKMLELLNHKGTEHYPGNSVKTDGEIEQYVREFAGSMYHPCCSCKMGSDSDPMAVLDASLSVRKTKNLKVVDASSFPEIIGANTNATCIALGERGAQIIIEEDTHM